MAFDYCHANRAAVFVGIRRTPPAAELAVYLRHKLDERSEGHLRRVAVHDLPRRGYLLRAFVGCRAYRVYLIPGRDLCAVVRKLIPLFRGRAIRPRLCFNCCHNRIIELLLTPYRYPSA